jgi:hypothetical protein
LLKKCSGHGVGEMAGLMQKLPAGHVRHVAELDAPIVKLYFPVGHAVITLF